MNPEAPNQENNNNAPQPPAEQSVPQDQPHPVQVPPVLSPQNMPQSSMPQQTVAPVVMPPVGASPQQNTPGMQMNTSPTVVSPKPGGSKKNILILAIVGGLIALVGLVAVLLMVFLAGPSKDDYKNAIEKMSTTSSTYLDSTSAHLSQYSTETELKNGTEKQAEASKKLAASLDELANDKVIKSDADAAKQWKLIADKREKLNELLGTISESNDKILPVLITSENVTSSSDSARAELVALKARVDGITGIKYSVNKTFVDAYKAPLGELITLLDQITASKKYDSDLTKRYYGAASKMSDAVSDWRSNLDKLGDQGDISKDLYKLMDIVGDKYIKMK